MLRPFVLASLYVAVAALLSTSPSWAAEEAGPAQTSAPAALHTPPPEALVDTPVPLYVELPEGEDAQGAVVLYKASGDAHERRIDMRRMGRGFGALIPCEVVTISGPISYRFEFLDEKNQIIKTLGTPEDPFRVTLTREIEGEEPHLPGESPPPFCRTEEADPPCVFDETQCSEQPNPSWPWPPPKARAKGCAGCKVATSSPEGFPLSLFAVLMTMARRARRKAREKE